jgi:hypothetical protein
MTFLLAAILVWAVQMLAHPMWTRKPLLSGLRMYAREFRFVSPRGLADIDGEIGTLRAPRILHCVISPTQIGIRLPWWPWLQPGIYGIMTLSDNGSNAHLEMRLDSLGSLFYALVLLFFCTQSELSLWETVVLAVWALIYPLGGAMVVDSALAKLKSR